MVPAWKTRSVRLVFLLCIIAGTVMRSSGTDAERMELAELLDLMDGTASEQMVKDRLTGLMDRMASERTDYNDLLERMAIADETGSKASGELSLSALLERMHQAGAAQDRMPGGPRKPYTSPMRGSERSLQVPYVDAEARLPADAKKDRSPSPGIRIDGQLDDPLWKQAVVSGDFWCSLENRAPEDPTEVLLIRDANYLYIGFRLYDRKPEAIRSATTVRDVGLGYDDSINVQLDTFFNRRDISEFSLNPGGTQSDAFSGGRAAKIEWKGDWLGSAARTDYGWSAEFAIPFAILNYNAGATTFGVNFRRYQSRTKQHSYWADVTPRGLQEEMGRLDGLILPASGDARAWTFMPFALAGANLPDKEGEIRDTLVTAGIDIRYQPRPDATAMLSINPDFSQVEEAVADISFSYSEKAVADNRPFFAEGKKYFSAVRDGNEYFYSNRAADFDVGGKGFGRTGNTQLGLLATLAPDDRFDGVGRMLHEFDATHSAVASVTATHQDGFDNVLAVGQFYGHRPSGLEYSFDAAATSTQTNGISDAADGTGGHFMGMLGWRADYWYLQGEVERYDVDYFPALGLLDTDLPGTQAGTATTGYYREHSDRIWQTIDVYTGFKYRETTESEQLQNRKWFAGGSLEFENQIRTTLYREEGPYRPVTSTRGVFEDFTYDDRYSSLGIDFFTRSTLFSCGSRYDWGELGGEDYRYYTAYGWWKPVNPLYLNLSVEHTDSYGAYDQILLTGSWNITPEHTLGGRYIYTDEIDYYRLAYSFKPRRGWDIFAVYDDNSAAGKEGEYSLKVVKTF